MILSKIIFYLLQDGCIPGLKTFTSLLAVPGGFAGAYVVDFP